MPFRWLYFNATLSYIPCEARVSGRIAHFERRPPTGTPLPQSLEAASSIPFEELRRESQRAAQVHKNLSQVLKNMDSLGRKSTAQSARHHFVSPHASFTSPPIEKTTRVDSRNQHHCAMGWTGGTSLIRRGLELVLLYCDTILPGRRKSGGRASWRACP